MPRFRATWLAHAAALALAAGPALAADRTWDGNGGDDTWSFRAADGNTNWTHSPPAGMPVLAGGDRLIFAGATRLTSLNDYAGLWVSGLVFKQDAGAFNLGGHRLASTGDIVNTSANVQTLSFATLAVDADQIWDGGRGGLVVNGFTLDRHTLELRGTTRLRQNVSSMVVGRTAAATLRAGAGSSIESDVAFVADQAGSAGTVLLDQGARWTSSGLFYVGTRGEGRLELRRGSRLESQGGHVGRFAGSTGSVLIDDASTWDSGTTVLRVGFAGNGRLESAGAVTAHALTLGEAGGSGEATFSGPSARLSPQAFGGVAVALGNTSGGLGRLTFRSGAEAELGGIEIQAATAGSDGLGSRLVVTDGARVWARATAVGANSALSVSGGASLQVWDLMVGFDPSPLASPGTARVDVEGGALRVLGNAWIGQGQAAQLRLSGGQTNADDVYIGNRGSLVLDGGTLVAETLNTSGDGSFVWRAGNLSLSNVELVSNSALGSLLVVPAQSTLTSQRTASIGPGSLLVLSQPGARLMAPGLSLDGGTVVGPLSLDEVRGIGGHGTVLGRVTGGSGNRSIAVHAGDLTLGSLALDDAVELGTSILVANGRTLLLLSANPAQLGPNTRLQDAARLASVNGAVLGAGDVLETPGFHARVQGRFVNDGRVQAHAQGSITFEDDVSGSGSYAGRIVFSDGFTPAAAGNAFGFGDVSFDATSELRIAIGSTPSSVDGHPSVTELKDIGSLRLEGRLALNFDASFAAQAAGGLVLDLMDFTSFAGAFSPDQVQVSGFDAARLDFSRFTLDGTVAVAAVPEPASWALMALGVAALLTRRRFAAAAGRA